MLQTQTISQTNEFPNLTNITEFKNTQQKPRVTEKRKKRRVNDTNCPHVFYNMRQLKDKKSS